MIRFLFRLIGLILLALAFILVVYDGMRSIGDSAVSITSLRTLWLTVEATSLQQLQPLIVERAGGWLWDLIFVPLLNAPSWSVLGILGIVMIMLGRRKKPLIGYAR